MAFTYKIREFNSAEGQIIATIHDDASATVGTMAVDLPRDEGGLYLVGSALNDYIMGFIPADFYTEKAAIKAGVANASAITALLDPLPAEEEEEADVGDEAATIFIDARLTHHGLI